MTKYNIVFFGTTNFSVKILESLFKRVQIKVQLVVTQPDRKVGRKQELVPSPVKNWAKINNIPVEQPEALKTLNPLIAKLKPDFLITAAYGQKIPKEMLQIAKIEALNVHGSLLPAYRGGAPVQMAIWNGDRETGVTVMRMGEAMDAGPIFGQKKLKLDQGITSGELMEKMALSGSELLNELIIPIAEHKVKPSNQDIHKVTFAYNIKPAQEKINWTQSALQIHNQVRALMPQPGAFTLYKTQRLKIFKSNFVLNSNSKYSPGTIIALNKHSFTVQTGNGILEILELQKAGKNKVNGGIFGKNNLKIGEQFN